jgi:hypothetical protein
MSDSNNMKIVDNPYKKYHGNIPGGTGRFLTPTPLTDEEIDGILLLGQEARKEQQEILEDSYGPGFYNVKNLERERKYNTMFLWSPFISYTEPTADELENGQFFKRIQMVSTRYEEENLAECVPETKYYDGTTICYDDYGYETYKEITTTTKIEELATKKPDKTYTRKDGLIIIDYSFGAQDVFFDLGLPEMPVYDKESMSLYQLNVFGAKVKTPKTDTTLSKEELLAQLDTNLRANKRIPNEEIERRKQVLSQAYDKQKEIKPLQEKIDELENQVLHLQSMLSRSLEFADTVRKSPVGKMFFGKKAKELLGDNDKDTKQISDGREK